MHFWQQIGEYYFLFIIVPLAGCDVISNDGACFSFFTYFAINWRDARVECLLRGYDLASLTSSQENTLLFGTGTAHGCWIGLNDIGNRLTFTWIDGSDSACRLLHGNSRPYYLENCIELYSYAWRYTLCTDTRSCFCCRANGKYNCVYLCVGLKSSVFS